MVQGNGQMSEADEEGADKNKQSNAFQHERQSFRLAYLKKNHKKPKDGESLIENEIYVKGRNIIQNNIRHGVARAMSRVDIGEGVDEKTCRKKQKTQENVAPIWFVRPAGLMLMQCFSHI